MDITTQGQGYEAYHLGGERSQEETADCRTIDVVMEVSIDFFCDISSTVCPMCMTNHDAKMQILACGYEYMIHLHFIILNILPALQCRCMKITSNQQL